MRHPQALTTEQANELSVTADIIDVALHPAILPEFVEWLDSRGLGLVPIKFTDEESEPAYIVSPDDI